MASLIRLRPYGNDMLAIFDSGERVLCHPLPNGEYLPNIQPIIDPDPGDPGDPGDPPPSGDSTFVWPFAPSTFNENNGRPQDGWRTPQRPNHRAIDMAFGAATNGALVPSSAAGRVRFAGWHDLGGGYRVEVDHGLHNGRRIVTTYNHMQSGSLLVAVNDTVTQGQPLGKLGSTGNSTGPHLHYEVWDYSAVTDPSYDKRINPHIFMAEFNPDNEYA